MKKKIIIIVILAIAVLGVGGFIVYDCFIKKDDTKCVETEKDKEQVNDSKEENDKDKDESKEDLDEDSDDEDSDDEDYDDEDYEDEEEYEYKATNADEEVVKKYFELYGTDDFLYYSYESLEKGKTVKATDISSDSIDRFAFLHLLDDNAFEKDTCKKYNKYFNKDNLDYCGLDDEVENQNRETKIVYSSKLKEAVLANFKGVKYATTKRISLDKFSGAEYYIFIKADSKDIKKDVYVAGVNMGGGTDGRGYRNNTVDSYTLTKEKLEITVNAFYHEAGNKVNLKYPKYKLTFEYSEDYNVYQFVSVQPLK